MLVPVKLYNWWCFTTSVMVSWELMWALVFGPNRFFVLYSNLVKNGYKPLVPQGRTSQQSIEYVYLFSPTRNSSHRLRLLSFIFNVYSKMSHNILQQLNLVWWVLGTRPIDVGIYVVGYTCCRQCIYNVTHPLMHLESSFVDQDEAIQRKPRSLTPRFVNNSLNEKTHIGLLIYRTFKQCGTL